MKRSIINFIAFQGAWFACILGAAYERPWTGVIAVAALAVMHMLFMVRSDARFGETVLLLGAAALGWIGDSLLVVTGVLTFAESAQIGGPSPWWMVALWVNLAMTLRFSMGWMRGRMAVAAVFGAIGGPLAYFAGAKLGAVTLGVDLFAGLGAVAALWAAAMPLLLVLERRTNFAGMGAAE